MEKEMEQEWGERRMRPTRTSVRRLTKASKLELTAREEGRERGGVDEVLCA